MGLVVRAMFVPRPTALPLAGLPFTETISPIYMNGMKLLETIGGAIPGELASLEGSETSSRYVTAFWTRISRIVAGSCDGF